MAIPFLWKEPFTGSLNSIKSIILVNVLVSNFSEQELKDLNLIPILNHNPTTFNYITFIRTLIVNAVIEAAAYWLQNNPNISNECPIGNSLLKNILLNASNLEHIISNSNVNVFQFPISKNYFSNLIELTGFDEGISGIYSSISNVAENIKILRFSLTNNHHIKNSNTTIVNDISKIIKNQKNLQHFSVDNRLNCYCCSQEFSSLDFTSIFNSLTTQSETLRYIGLYDINFFSNFPLNQLTLCKNLNHLEITRCYNFGIELNFNQFNSNYSFKRLNRINIYYSTIPSNILKYLLSQSGKSLRKIKLIGNEVMEDFHDIIQHCIIYNSNLTHFLSFIYSKEIELLPKFFKSCQFLKHFEIWDINYSSNIINKDNMINVDKLLIDISESIPSSLKIFNIIMNWSFSPNYFESFLKNLEIFNVQLDYLGFPFCSNFTNDHLEIIIKNLRFPLKWLNIRNANNIQYDDVERSTKFVKNLVVPNNIRRFVEYDKYFFDIINQNSF
ncbi:hypothetical protein RclHR1_03800018 [Rhizophagus clarus]|uniref:F-box domain-containing protein n=1 Tax=Rhizophagus clarus TaxID=94130 RepID=A0A2Z6RUR8_9GLOM|nr:hypothetical protein RclHR1_03800018 [Rhizophagus clarus]